MAASETLRSVGTHLRGLLFSTALGIAGGVVCGAAIVSFGMLIGRTGTTGDHMGNWSVGALGVGAMFGAPLGAIVAPIAYATLVRTIGMKQAILPATLGTLAGGFAGILILGTPPFAALTGIIGFFAALLCARIRMRMTSAG